MTDEQTAAAIVADSRNACDETAMEAAIVRALQAARESALDTHANGAVLRMCHEARMCNGIVDYSDPKAVGVVRRVMHVSKYPGVSFLTIHSEAAEAAKEAQ